MKNGVLSALFVFVSIAGMQQQEQESASLSIPGEVCDIGEDVKRTLDLQVADCIAELIQCSVEYGIFSRGTEDEAANLFFCKEIDTRHLLNSDIRSVGKWHVKKRKRALEAELLRTFARGGTCKKLLLYTSIVQKEEPVDREVRETIGQERDFYNKELPRILGLCDTRVLQRLINADEQLRACLTLENLPFNDQILFGVVTKGSFNAQDAADSLYVLCQAGCTAARAFAAVHKSRNESIAQNSSGLCARALQELCMYDDFQAACHVAKSDRGNSIIAEFLERLDSPPLPKTTELLNCDQPIHGAHDCYELDCQEQEGLASVFSRQTTEGESSLGALVESGEKCEQGGFASVASGESTERVPSSVSSATAEEKPKKSLREYLCNCACL